MAKQTAFRRADVGTILKKVVQRLLVQNGAGDSGGTGNMAEVEGQSVDAKDGDDNNLMQT